MADSEYETDYGDTGGDPSESEESLREAAGGDSTVDDDEWGFDDRKPGLASETKAGLAVIAILSIAFCMLVWNKFDNQKRGIAGLDETEAKLSQIDGDGTSGDSGLMAGAGSPFGEGMDQGPLPSQSEPDDLDPGFDPGFDPNAVPENLAQNEPRQEPAFDPNADPAGGFVDNVASGFADEPAGAMDDPSSFADEPNPGAGSTVAGYGGAGGIADRISDAVSETVDDVGDAIGGAATSAADSIGEFGDIPTGPASGAKVADTSFDDEGGFDDTNFLDSVSEDFDDKQKVANAGGTNQQPVNEPAAAGMIDDQFFDDEPSAKADTRSAIADPGRFPPANTAAAADPASPAKPQDAFDALLNDDEPTFDDSAFEPNVAKTVREPQFDQGVIRETVQEPAPAQAKPITNDFNFADTRQPQRAAVQPVPKPAFDEPAFDEPTFDEPAAKSGFDDRGLVDQTFDDRAIVDQPVREPAPNAIDPNRFEQPETPRGDRLDDIVDSRSRTTMPSNNFEQQLQNERDLRSQDLRTARSSDPIANSIQESSGFDDIDVVRQPDPRDQRMSRDDLINSTTSERRDPRFDNRNSNQTMDNGRTVVDSADSVLFDDQPVADSGFRPTRRATQTRDLRSSRPASSQGMDDRGQMTREEIINQRLAESRSKYSERDRQGSGRQSDYRTAGRTDYQVANRSDERYARVNAEPAVLRRSDVKQSYVVQPGDNYWRISKNQYGSPKFYKALEQLNIKRVTNPKQLRVGSSILTPSPEELVQRFPRLFPNGLETVSSRQAPSRPGFFTARDGRAMYRTARKDTLSSIAQKHLGRSSRWKQIYQLNRHLLDNPNEVNPGLVLLLPDDASQVLLMR